MQKQSKKVSAQAAQSGLEGFSKSHGRRIAKKAVSSIDTQDSKTLEKKDQTVHRTVLTRKEKKRTRTQLDAMQSDNTDPPQTQAKQTKVTALTKKAEKGQPATKKKATRRNVNDLVLAQTASNVDKPVENVKVVDASARETAATTSGKQTVTRGRPAGSSKSLAKAATQTSALDLTAGGKADAIVPNKGEEDKSEKAADQVLTSKTQASSKKQQRSQSTSAVNLDLNKSPSIDIAQLRNLAKNISIERVSWQQNQARQVAGAKSLATKGAAKPVSFLASLLPAKASFKQVDQPPRQSTVQQAQAPAARDQVAQDGQRQSGLEGERQPRLEVEEQEPTFTEIPTAMMFLPSLTASRTTLRQPEQPLVMQLPPPCQSIGELDYDCKLVSPHGHKISQFYETEVKIVYQSAEQKDEMNLKNYKKTSVLTEVERQNIAETSNAWFQWRAQDPNFAAWDNERLLYRQKTLDYFKKSKSRAWKQFLHSYHRMKNGKK